MNLLERLSPEHLEMLKAEEQKFPLTIKNLIAELDNQILKMEKHLGFCFYQWNTPNQR